MKWKWQEERIEMLSKFLGNQGKDREDKRLIYADYNPYTNSIDVNTFENYILRIAAFCGLSFLLAIKITSKLSIFILHQFGGLHKLWDTPIDRSIITLLNYCCYIRCFVRATILGDWIYKIYFLAKKCKYISNVWLLITLVRQRMYICRTNERMF